MVSIIIPTLNEEAHITTTLKWLKERVGNYNIEIIVVDGGSIDDTIQKAGEESVRVIVSPRKGRAIQMNYGASVARGTILYFLHSDTLPPDNFLQDIVDSFRKGYSCGCFMLSFNYAHWFLKAHCWFTQFDINQFRFGDQSLFVSKEVFCQAGGFNERHHFLEDQEIVRRLKKYGHFTVVRKPVLTSARKYLANGIYRTQGIFYLIYLMYSLGYSQERLREVYNKLINRESSPQEPQMHE